MKKIFIAFELVAFVFFGGVLGWGLEETVLSTKGVAPAFGVIIFFFLWVFYVWKNFRL